VAKSETPGLPRLPWYPRDFASATRGWPLVARAVYRELLDASWDVGGLPNDEVLLKKMAGASTREWNRAWPLVREKWQVDDDGFLRNARLEQHRRYALDQREKAKNKAVNAAKTRWKRGT
jgi:uncharacterized protein YdaU (DUF1376 family)